MPRPGRSGSRASRRRSRVDGRGSVTAETAAVLPVLAAAVLGLVWLVSLTVAQARVVDAARETARLAARGEATSLATAVGRRIAPDGARIRVGGTAGTPTLVTVEVTADVTGPGRLLAFLPPVTLRHEAVAAREPG